VRREEEIVREIIESWLGTLDEMKACWAEHCHEDVIWWNSARGALHGIEANLAAFDKLAEMTGFKNLRSIPQVLLAGDGVVMVERAEDLLDADGNSMVHIKVNGVIKFEGEKIIEWRDYCVDWLAAWRPEGESTEIAEHV
jgi:limonene-1,2-epoxide hydrolase